jgi:hypothetical protein
MSLELVRCGICEKATVVRRGERHVCPECLEEEQKLYTKVRNLLRDHHWGGLTIKDVAERIAVEERKITHLVDSGYFKLARCRLWPNDPRNEE